MQNYHSISLAELMVLNIYLGSIIFILGTFLLFFLIRKKKALKIILFIIVLQLGSAILLSLLLWKLWSFKIDIMYGFIFYPAMFSEIGTILFILGVLKIIKNRRYFK